MLQAKSRSELFETPNSIYHRIITDIIKKYIKSEDAANILKYFRENIKNCEIEDYAAIDNKTCLDYIAIILRFVQKSTEGLVKDYNDFCLAKQNYHTKYEDIKNSLERTEAELANMIALPERMKSPFDLNMKLMTPTGLPKIDYINHPEKSLSDIEKLIQSNKNLDSVLTKLHDKDGHYNDSFVSDRTAAMVQKGRMPDFYSLYDNFILKKDEYNSSTVELKHQKAQIQKEQAEWENKINDIKSAFIRKFIQEGKDHIFLERLIEKIHFHINNNQTDEH